MGKLNSGNGWQVDLDTRNCELSPADIQKVEECLSPLRKAVDRFPFANLAILIEYMRPNNDYRIKVGLLLPGKGMMTGDTDTEWYPAVRRNVRKLIHKVAAYKQRMGNNEEASKLEKGTRQEMHPATIIDDSALAQAAAEGDYAGYRRLLYPFEETIRNRAGRWVQRYPEIESDLGTRFELDDIVEEVFLNAFERHDERPENVPFGDWLEAMIDPSVRMLHDHPDEELQNIHFARSAADATPTEPPAQPME